MNAPRPAMKVGLWLPCRTLWQREMVRFLRQRSRVIGALGTPIVFWLLMGAGLQRSLQPPGASSSVSYLEFSYPGAIAAILLFTAIFSMISLIDDRREGFLQGVLVAPVSRAAIALGKTFGATTLAVGQSLVFLLLSPLAGLRLSAGAIGATILALTVIAFGLTSLGFIIAWKMESTQGFHAIMNLLLMPMLILSGGFFPATGSAAWLRAIIAANPMTYAIGLLRHTLYFRAGSADGPSLSASLGVSLVFSAAMFIVSVILVSRDGARAVS